MERLGVKVSLTSWYRPQANGQVERINQEVGRFLRCYCQDWPGEGADFLPSQSMRRTPSATPPLTTLLFSAGLGISWPRHVGIRARLRPLRWTSGFGLVRRPGTLRTCLQRRHKEQSDAPPQWVSLLSRQPGLALHPEPAPPPALPEAEPAVCGAI